LCLRLIKGLTGKKSVKRIRKDTPRGLGGIVRVRVWKSGAGQPPKRRVDSSKRQVGLVQGKPRNLSKGLPPSGVKAQGGEIIRQKEQKPAHPKKWKKNHTVLLGEKTGKTENKQG